MRITTRRRLRGNAHGKKPRRGQDRYLLLFLREAPRRDAPRMHYYNRWKIAFPSVHLPFPLLAPPHPYHPTTREHLYPRARHSASIASPRCMLHGSVFRFWNASLGSLIASLIARTRFPSSFKEPGTAERNEGDKGLGERGNWIGVKVDH